MLNTSKKDIFKQEREALIAFHGHACGGLYLGMRMVDIAKESLNYQDENHLIVVTETDMCGVDALQFLCSCTFGKGNLIHRDYGKNAFTFYDTKQEKALRVLLKASTSQLIEKELAQNLSEEIKSLLDADAKNIFFLLDSQDLFEVQEVPFLPPKPPRVLQSLQCEVCKEYVMESRIRHLGGQLLCIPCFNKLEQKL